MTVTNRQFMTPIRQLYSSRLQLYWVLGEVFLGIHYQSKMEKNCPIKLMMVIFRFSNAFENRIYLGVDLMLNFGVGLAYMLYTKPEVHIIKNLFSILF